MIAYDLKCANGHVFEGWFDDLEAYEQQKEKGLICCPVCEDDHIERMPSMFAIKTSSGTERKIPGEEGQLEQLEKQMANYIEKNFDDVGSNFAKEALKIHYGASEPRNIRGSSSQEEEKILRKEGVKFLKLPVPASHDREDA